MGAIRAIQGFSRGQVAEKCGRSIPKATDVAKVLICNDEAMKVKRDWVTWQLELRDLVESLHPRRRSHQEILKKPLNKRVFRHIILHFYFS